MIRKAIFDLLNYIFSFDKNINKNSTKVYRLNDEDIVSDTTIDKLFNLQDVEKALEKAWHNRDFEIELYWKRSTYFWTFIGATFLGYFALIGSKNYQDYLVYNYYHLESFIITIGLIFSIGWYFVNRGSKSWQENWERQIDQLEKMINRPNYSVIFKKRNQTFYSVSRINQLVSLYVVIIWLILYLSYWARFYSYYLFFKCSVSIYLLNILSILTIPGIIIFLRLVNKKAKSGISKTTEEIDKLIKDDYFFLRRE